MIIDVHTHILPAGWPELGDRSPRFERMDETHARIMVGARSLISSTCIPSRAASASTTRWCAMWRTGA